LKLVFVYIAARIILAHFATFAGMVVIIRAGNF